MTIKDNAFKFDYSQYQRQTFSELCFSSLQLEFFCFSCNCLLLIAFKHSVNFYFLAFVSDYFHSSIIVVITTAQLSSTKPEFRFRAGLNLACGLSEICDGENLWQWSLLEIRLKAFHWSTIPHKQISINSSYPHEIFNVVSAYPILLLLAFASILLWVKLNSFDSSFFRFWLQLP